MATRRKRNSFLNARRNNALRTAAIENARAHGLIWRTLATYSESLAAARAAPHRLADTSIECSLPSNPSTPTDTLPPCEDARKISNDLSRRLSGDASTKRRPMRPADDTIFSSTASGSVRSFLAGSVSLAS